MYTTMCQLIIIVNLLVVSFIIISGCYVVGFFLWLCPSGRPLPGRPDGCIPKYFPPSPFNLFSFFFEKKKIRVLEITKYKCTAHYMFYYQYCISSTRQSRLYLLLYASTAQAATCPVLLTTYYYYYYYQIRVAVAILCTQIASIRAIRWL